MKLHWIDITILVVYLLGIAVIGVLLSEGVPEPEGLPAGGQRAPLYMLDKLITEKLAGALIWSFRYHNRDGGFYWHHEPAGGDPSRPITGPDSPSARSMTTPSMDLLRHKAHEIRVTITTVREASSITARTPRVTRSARQPASSSEWI